MGYVKHCWRQRRRGYKPWALPALLAGIYIGRRSYNIYCCIVFRWLQPKERMGWGQLSWHLLSAGIWSGCVATEVFFEKILGNGIVKAIQESSSSTSCCCSATPPSEDEKKSRLVVIREVQRLLAKLHYYVDLCIELPASLLVVGTGLKLMIGRRPLDITIHIMSTIGLTAMICNFACFYHVKGRYDASLLEDWEKYEHHDRWQHRVGKGVVHSLLVSMGLGLYMSIKD